MLFPPSRLGVWGNNVSLLLSIFRDLYTLDWNKVKSYQVGSCTNENPKPEIEDAELMVYSVSQFDLASIKLQDYCVLL